MATSRDDKNRGAPRILGCQERMGAEPQVEAWVPRSRKEVEELPPLPPPSRGGKAGKDQEAPRRSKVTIRLEPPAPEAEGPRRQPTAEKMPDAAKRDEPAREPAGTDSSPSAPGPPPRRALPDGVAEGSVRAMIWEHVEDTARLVRTMLMEEEEEGEEGKEQEIPTMQKAAILLVGLGEGVSGEVMKYMSDYEIEEITQAIAGLKNVTTELRDQVLEEFRQHLQAGEWVVQGGIDFARGALERAVGPRKAQEIFDRVVTKVSSGFYMLRNVAPDQIAPFISNEHPQTIALILSQLDPAQAAGILAQLPERMQADVSYRITTMENITPNVIPQLEEFLERSLRDILGGNTDVGGPKVMADILNLTGSSVEKNVLDQMDGQDPEVAEAVRNLMFVFEDIVRLSDEDLEKLGREIAQKEELQQNLVVALKACSKQVKDKILGKMPEEQRTAIAGEAEALGPRRLREVEEAQLRVVQQLRELEERGDVTIVRGVDADDELI